MRKALIFFALLSSMFMAKAQVLSSYAHNGVDDKTPHHRFFVGIDYCYGTETESGGGLVLGYAIDSDWTVALSGHPYKETELDVMGTKTTISPFELNLNMHYNIIKKDNMDIYALAGICYAASTTRTEVGGNKSSETKGKEGLNLGGGAQYYFAKHFAVQGEVKYEIIKDSGQFHFSVGVAYGF